MKNSSSLVWLMSWTVAAGLYAAEVADPPVQPTGRGSIQHTLACADYSQGKIFILAPDGRVEWEYAASGCNDLWVLPNGNLLFNTGHGVKEVTRKKEVVFTYESKSEIYACQRLSDGTTFVGECNAGRLLELGPRAEIKKELRLLPAGADGGHLYMRNARRLDNGHYLVAHYGQQMVKEYDADGKVVRQIPAPGGPHSVARLANGHTIVACGDLVTEGPGILEVDAQGKVVWSVDRAELPGISLKFMGGFQRLPNGNTLMANWLGHGQFGKAPHLIEVTPDKKVVWLLKEHPAIKTISTLQVLDDVPAAAPKLSFRQLLLIQRHELNPTHVYTYHVEGFQAGGGLYVYTVGAPPELRELASSPQGEILDCDPSYDAREILFSWRRTQSEGYHVFVVNADGTHLRQLTEGPQHDYNACWLPDGGIAFLSTRSSRFAYCWISPVGILHRMDRDGSNVHQLSANIVNDFTPSVMSDGRLIYSRWEYVDKPAIPIQSLWTIHPDGTGLAGYYGNRVLSPATFMEARSVPGKNWVICTLTSHNGPARGAIGIIDISQGNNAQASIRNLTPEVNIGLVDKGDGNQIRGPYENAYPLDAEHYLVSKGGTILVRNLDGTEETTIIGPRNGLGFYSAQPLRPRQKPPVLASPVDLAAVPIAPPAPLPGEHIPAAHAVAWATVVLQDVYRGLEPQVKRGEIKEICVVEEMRKAVRTDVAHRAFGFQFPVISCGATYAGKKVWGYAPVAPNGSACFRVPAGVPIYFMALDAHGRALQRMRTFTHLMPGEIQGCVGCHEPRQQAVAATQALPRQPDRLRPPEWGEGLGFDYATFVQPVLDRHCTECHSGSMPPAKVDLGGDKTDFFNTSYEVLARGRRRAGEAEWDSPYVSWIPTFNGMEQNILEITPKAWGSPRSKLADLVLNGHPDTNGVTRLKMEPYEIRRILAWIDLNVPYYGTSETAYPEMTGCRRIYPSDLDKVLADVGVRRCAQCHKQGQFPRQIWTRITRPELNNFLLAPLAKSAGGSEACGQPVFSSTADADYVAILKTFDPIRAMLEARPRMDMPGAKAALVDRSCLGKLD